MSGGRRVPGLVLVVASVMLAGCMGPHTAADASRTTTPAAVASVDLSVVVVRPSDLPGWRQVLPAGREATNEKALDESVASCMKGSYATRASLRGATMTLGSSPDQQEIQSFAGEYASPATAESIATSPRWAPCSATSVRDQILASSKWTLVGSVHAEVRQADLAHRVALMRISYELTDGRVDLEYFDDVAWLWHGRISATLYLDSTRQPISSTLEQHLTSLVAARL